MIYLLLTLAGSCVISLIFKIVSINHADSKQIVFLNYLIAAIGLIICTAVENGTHLQVLLSENLSIVSILAMLLLAAGLAISMITNLVYTDINTEKNGLGNTTFFNRAGFLPCILLEAVVWREIPNGKQLIGMVLLIIALYEMYRAMRDSQEEAVRGWHLLGILFISNGLVSFLNSAYGRYYSENLQNFFLAAVFVIAAVISAVRLKASGKSIKTLQASDCKLGIVLGISNLITTLFMLKSFSTLGAGITAPSISAGNVLFSMVVGRLFYQEKTDYHSYLALVLAMISMILVNI